MARDYEVVFVTCLIQLFSKLYYFNFEDLVLNEILKHLGTRNHVIVGLLTDFLTDIFERDNPSTCEFSRLLQVKAP